jgi:hypothetical protein
MFPRIALVRGLWSEASAGIAGACSFLGVGVHAVVLGLFVFLNRRIEQNRDQGCE